MNYSRNTSFGSRNGKVYNFLKFRKNRTPKNSLLNILLITIEINVSI